jgi:hypothetical protein
MVMAFLAWGEMTGKVLQLIASYFCHWDAISHQPLHFLLPQAMDIVKICAEIDGIILH